MTGTTKQDFSKTESKRYILYRNKLISSGFTEASLQHGHFFRITSDKTAFVINLYDDEYSDEYGMSILYGFASTASMKGDEDWFAKNGSDDDTCQLRNIMFVGDENETTAFDTISGFYYNYKDYSKDEILALKNERQKTFLNHFSQELKPLGFKKKGTKWTKDIGGGTSIIFEAQKSAFSDKFYFNVIIHNAAKFPAVVSFKRVVMYNNEIYNWQLMTEKQINDLIHHTLSNYILPLISNHNIADVN